MGYTKAILFDLVEQSANYGNIISSITDTTPINSRNVYYEIIGPLGTAIRLPDFNTPDGVLDIGTPTASMPLVLVPLNTDGTFQEGSYTIRFYIEDQSNPGVYTQVNSTFTLDVLKQGTDCECALTPKLKFGVNCHCCELSVTDVTSYPTANNFEMISKEITVVLPTIAPNPAPAPITTTDDSITLAFDYSNVSYTATMYMVYEQTYNNGEVTVREDISVSKTEKIKCDFNLCKLLECINAKLKELNKKARNYGGLSQLPNSDLDLLLMLVEKLALLQAYMNCRDYEKVQCVYDEIRKAVNCDCGCSNDKTDRPVPVVPACGGASGTILSIVGNSPIRVSQVAGTATISLDPAWIANITAQLAAAVQDIDTDTPDYITITNPAPNQYNVNFNDGWTAYTTLTNAGTGAGDTGAAPNVDFDATPVPLRWRINTIADQNKLEVDGSFIYGGTMPMWCLNASALDLGLAVTRQGAPATCFVDGVCVGNLELLIGTPSNLTHFVFNPNADYNAGDTVYVNGIFPIN